MSEIWYEGPAHDGPLEGRTFRFNEDSFRCRLNPGEELAEGEVLEHKGLYRWSAPNKRWEFDWADCGLVKPGLSINQMRQSLVTGAKSFDDEQRQRALEFNEQVRKAFAKGRRPRDHVSYDWLMWRLEAYKFSSALPGRMLPRLLFGEDYASHPGYIPMERRIVLTHYRFNEIYSAGDKTPRRNMVQVQ